MPFSERDLAPFFVEKERKRWHCTCTAPWWVQSMLKRGTPISCFGWGNFQARRLPGSECVTWLSPVETGSKCRRDGKWSFMGLESKSRRAKDGLFQVLYLSYERSVCITHHCLPEHILVSRAVIALLYFEFTPLFGRCSHRRPSRLTSRYLTAWEGFYRVWQMQKPWITCYSYGVWVFHVQVIVICPPFF